MLRRALFAFAIGIVAVVGLATALGRGWLGVRQDRGAIATTPRPQADTLSRVETQRGAATAVGVSGDRQILFGDLHVHTTFSFDAFMISLPMYQGEGVHPPADACDFARFCSALDFWSINDHAEGLTPHQWRETREAIRQCDAVAGDGENPDLVSFLGWEWTQIGRTTEDHYGHKNVVLRDLAGDRVPARPISSRPELFPPSSGAQPLGDALRVALIAGAPGGMGRQPYLDFARFLQDRDDLSPCQAGAPTRSLPDDCQESASRPRDLFGKLDAWGFPYLVIPHGNTWGIYTPPRSSWDRQLAENPDPIRTEPLVEVFSGHGNSEEYRPWRAVAIDADGRPRCPEPSPGYLPECWRAGEIIEARCLAAGENDAECRARAAAARQQHADGGIAGHLVVPGTRAEDWLDAGQCSDCYLPAYSYRPGGASQYALAKTDFSDPRHPKRYRFGFMASSDGHTARPGTGYKEIHRRLMTDASLAQVGPPSFGEEVAEPFSTALPPDAPATPDFERSSSFFGSGGLVAVHAAGRSRGAIWDALESREVYGTSGDRILLWFDWLDPDGERPMGAEVRTAREPHFRVRTAGAFAQRPGCPKHASETLGAERLEHLCRGECYRPDDRRRRITRIEVIRVRPQIRPDEPIDALIEDPWRVLPCAPDASGCVAEFSDPEYVDAGRDTTYYVRAIQEPTPTLNGAGLRCTRDGQGRCLESRPCYGDARSDGDDCTALAEERAWSSPIFLVWEGASDGDGSLSRASP